MITQVHQTYPLFEKNQVLTHSQLNQMVSYLEEQGRLTRTGLIGIGIVCGLDVKPGSGGKSIQISEGLGITSEGDLLKLCDCTVTQFRSYNFGSFVDYAPFQDDETGEQDVDLWELLSEDFEDDESDEEIHPLEEMDLDEKVVMLFLEVYDRDLKSCLSKGCDEMGVERKLNIRKLLIGIDDLDKVLEQTNNRDITHFAKRFELEDYALKQALFQPPAEGYDSIGRIGKVYADVLFAAEDNPVESILEYWQKAYEAFEPVLRPWYDENPFAGANQKREEWEDTFQEGVPDHLGIQYYYDFIKDLILAYREFREISFDLLSQCSPDSSLFPKHLILGEITDECKPSRYRQPFIQTPVYNSQRQLLARTRSLFDRAVTMMRRFDTAVARKPGDFELRVTPSVEKRSGLSERSIPFYYPGIGEKDGPGSLEELWNYDLARRCAAEGGVPAYENNRSDKAESGELSPVSGPLHYDLDRYNFYRIEGCLGKPCEDVLTELNQRIRKYNLSFDLAAVRVNGDTASLGISDIDYSSGFHDLHEDYITSRYQLAGFLKSGLYTWELFQRFEEMGRKREGDFRRPLPDETREIFERAYEQIIGYLCGNLPPCIHDFIDRFEELKDGYAAAVEYAVDRILEEMDHRTIADLAYRVEGENGHNLFQNLVSLVSRFVFQVLDALFFHPLYRIYYAFRRREYYHRKHLESRYQTFSQYLEKHPGLNHMAGVPAGGTFVLLYGEVEGQPQRVAADFALPYRWCCDEELSIPVCDDAEAREQIEVAPFARPDFGFTFMNTPVVMDLVKNDHELYDLENEYCDEDEKALLNLAVVKVEPVGEIEEEAELEILNSKRSVRFTPPENFTGIFKFRYTLQKLSNGMTDEGVATVLVRDYCIRIKDYKFAVREGEQVSAVLPEPFIVRKFAFNDPEFDSEKVAIENSGNELHIKVQATPVEPWTFDYTASSPAEKIDGCGKITFVPGKEEGEQVKLEDFHFSVRQGEEVFQALFSEEIREKGYQVSSTMHNADVMSVEIIEGGMLIQVKKMIEEPHSFNYTAFAPGEPEGSGTVTLVPMQDVTVFYGDFTNDEIRGILQERDISFTSRDTKDNLIKKLFDGTREQPLTAGELNTLSDQTVKKLAGRLKIEEPETNKLKVIHTMTKILQ